MHVDTNPVHNLAQWRAGADAAQVLAGTHWYDEARALAAEWAEESGHTVETVAGVIAAFSQNATWKANVTMARNAIFGEDHEIRGLANVVAEVEDILYHNADPAVAIGAHGATGLKRADFYRNIAGDTGAVTCDRWHILAALGRKRDLTDTLRAILTEATAIVAAMYNEDPSTTQAIVWCAIRGTGE